MLVHRPRVPSDSISSRAANGHQGRPGTRSVKFPSAGGGAADQPGFTDGQVVVGLLVDP